MVRRMKKGNNFGSRILNINGRRRMLFYFEIYIKLSRQHMERGGPSDVLVPDCSGPRKSVSEP